MYTFKNSKKYMFRTFPLDFPAWLTKTIDIKYDLVIEYSHGLSDGMFSDTNDVHQAEIINWGLNDF